MYNSGTSALASKLLTNPPFPAVFLLGVNPQGESSPLPVSGSPNMPLELGLAWAGGSSSPKRPADFRGEGAAVSSPKRDMRQDGTGVLMARRWRNMGNE